MTKRLKNVHTSNTQRWNFIEMWGKVPGINEMFPQMNYSELFLITRKVSNLVFDDKVLALELLK